MATLSNELCLDVNIDIYIHYFSMYCIVYRLHAPCAAIVTCFSGQIMVRANANFMMYANEICMTNASLPFNKESVD